VGQPDPDVEAWAHRIEQTLDFVGVESGRRPALRPVVREFYRWLWDHRAESAVRFQASTGTTTGKEDPKKCSVRS
jgi:hypothetical protein